FYSFFLFHNIYKMENSESICLPDIEVLQAALERRDHDIDNLRNLLDQLLNYQGSFMVQLHYLNILIEALKEDDKIDNKINEILTANNLKSSKSLTRAVQTLNLKDKFIVDNIRKWVHEDYDFCSDGLIACTNCQK